MAVILNNKKSTNGGPYAFYTVETTNITNRTQTTVDITFKTTVNLQYSESLSGTGRPLTGGLYLNGNWYTFVIKNNSTSWSGTTKHYINTTITITGLTSTQSSITGVQFRSVGSSSYGATLSATSCSDIEIPIGHTPPSLATPTVTELNSSLAGVPNDTFVPHLSMKRFDLSAQFYDSATAQSYSLKYDGKEITSSQSSISINFITGSIAVTNNTVSISYAVTDSLGARTEIGPIIYNAIPYDYPAFSSTTSVKRYGQTSGLVRLNIAGTYFDGQIGNTTNDITIRYKYYEVNSSSSTYYTISSSDIIKDNGTFQVSNYEIGSTNPSDTNYFDYTKSYVVEILVEDAYSYKTIQKRITKGVPVWSEYSDRVWFEKAEAKNIYATEGIYLNGEPIGTGSKNILKASLSSNYSITSIGGKKITLNTVDFKKGDAFSISDGGIKIGAGITKVKVSCSVFFSAGTNAGDSLRAFIYHNNDYVAFNFARAGTNGTYETRNVIPTPIEVEEGDIIYLYAGNSTGSRGTIEGQPNSTYLIVEEI